MGSTKNIYIRILTIFLVLFFAQLRGFSQYSVTCTETNIVCLGQTDGTVTVTVTNGTPSYTYSLYIYNVGTGDYDFVTSQVSSSSPYTFSGLSTGKYYVEAADNAGNDEPSNYVTITAPAVVLTGSITSQTNLLCSGASTGSVTVQGYNGWGGFTYNIDGGSFQGSGTFINLTGGSHTVIVQDAGGCQVTVPVTITSPSPVTATITSQTNELCNGNSNGSATVAGGGGASPYTYSWTGGSANGKSTPTVSGLVASPPVYVCKVTDANGCSASVNVTITQPAVLSATISVVQNLTCYNGSNAILQGNPSGGTAPYTYSWSGAPLSGQSTQQVSGLPQGVYTCQFNDANNCAASPHTVIITIEYLKTWPAGSGIPAQIVINPNPPSFTNACTGQSNGTITILATGGTTPPPFTYSVGNGGTGTYYSGTITGLAAGTYQTWAKDGAGCLMEGNNVTIGSFPLPVPTLSGPATVCAGSGGNVYTSDAGMSNYAWTVSAGGTITAGGGAGNNTVTVTWNTVGAQTVSVNYTNSNGCTAASPTVENVTVNALPVPVIAGPASVCAGSAGNVYSTAAGQSNYAWTVSAGGTITAGGGAGNNTVTVTWNTAGARTVSVNYTNSNGCTASAPTSYPVTVNALPVPVIAGPASPCIGSVGNVYTTAAGQSNYAWTVSAGGTITAGGGAGNNTVTVTWNIAGAQTVSVNYTNSNGCTASAPTSYPVTVNALPVPVIAGPASPCIGSVGNVYTTAAGQSNYAWTVSAGGTITAGGGAGNNTVTVTWNIAGAQTVSVNYTNSNGCTASAPTSYPVTVNALPVPVIAGSASVCIGSVGNVYTTAAGQSNYAWTVSAGGTITAGGGAGNNTVTVTWNTAGAQTVGVNYTNSNGCTASAPTSYPVTVNALPVPVIAGPASVCIGSIGNVYTTAAGQSNYAWTVSAGGTITAGGGAGNNTVTVTWNIAGAQTVGVNYTNGNGCTASAPTSYPVTVNALPVPVIAGPASVCIGSVGNVYTTAAGQSNYAWTVSAGGTITAGGGAGNNTVTVTWNIAGAQTVSVNYTNSNGCTASSPTSYPVTVNALPVPVIAGPASPCIGSVGNVYSTAAGQSNYIWTVSAGGTITAGGGAGNNTVTVTWNVVGAQTVGVNYTNSNGCTASAPTSYPVTVNALPVPVIAGPASVCAGSAGNVYTTAAGQSNYAWTVSAGGTITAGGGAGNNTVTVTWNTAGAQTVGVNYTNSNGCTASAPTSYPVTVNALPVPVIAGPASPCIGSVGNVYSTAAGQSNYAWTVSAGGTITAGGGAGNNTVTVTWNTAGAQTVGVNYTNSNGCTASAPTSYPVTVNALPVPVIAGPASPCIGSVGNVYSTAAGQSNYAWTVSAGGSITAGGGAGNNTVTVTWNTAGAQTVSVNYTNSNGCTASAPTSYPVTVNALPTPVIAGPASVCAGSAGNVYSTAAGQSNYAWTVSAGGTITAGGGAGNNTVTVTWNTAGAQTVSVNYTNSNGCTASAPTSYPVTVNALPVPVIAGPASVCIGSIGNVYTTAAGQSNYAWTVSAGGTITAGGGAGNNTVTVTWNIAGAQTVSVNYTNSNGCTASAPTSYPVTVNALPVPVIAGSASVCIGSVGNVYTTAAGQSNYAWTVSAGGTITAGGGAGNNTVTVTWNIAGAQTVSVNYTNSNGCTASAPTSYPVTVNALPVPVIAGSASVCIGSVGNVYTTAAGQSNYAWTVSAGGTITAGGGAGNNTVTVTWNTVGAQTVSVNYTNSNGCTASAPTSYPVTVNALPVPVIAGPASVCAGSAGNVYSTAAGQSNYAWTVSAGGTITAGGGAGNNTVTVTWNTAGAQTVSVNYTNGNGCTASAPTSYPVTVNALPVPVIAGPASPCIGSVGNVYSTAAGQSNYAWTVSAGGTITAGGGAGNNTVTVTWNTAGAQTVSVNYTNSNGCTASSPTSYPVTVNALPVPVIAGPASPCIGSVGNVYSTAAGQSNYAWTVSAGGTITAGGGTGNNTVTVTWNVVGAQTVGVNYTNGSGCTASAPTSYPVTVNALPVPVIAGPASVCAGSAGNVYTTAAGQSNYAWTVSAGGTITAGGGAGNNTVTVTWNTAGAQTVGVNYTNSNGCTASAPTSYPVTVNALPVPVIAGPASPCIGSVGNVYSTAAGQSNYAWTVSAGGTITAGGGAGNNTVTVTWNTAGAQTVGVNYTNSNGCTASAPTSYPVTVNALPVPVIAGPASPCIGSVGNVYSTAAGQSNYAWTVSAGGSITAGGGAGNNTVTVTWNTAGAQTVSVNYTNSNGCTASAPTSYPVTVNALPTPVIAGPASVCAGSAGNVYSTAAGQSNYAWTVSAGGTITAGGGAGNNTVTVTWNTAGAQTVSVNYTNSNGCTASAPTSYPVTVNALPVPVIAGPASVCIGSIGNVYTTAAGQSNYAWTVSAGGTITAGGGAGNNTVTVTWNTAGAQTVSVNYTNGNGCTASAPTSYPVTVNALPVPVIAGPASVCIGSVGNVYSTAAGQSNYAWTVSAGGTITAGGGAGNNTVTVTWNTAGAQTVSVNYTNSNGCTASSPTSYPVTVNALPVPVIAGPASVCAGSVGNVYSTAAGQSNYAWTVSAGGTITAGGGAGNNTVTVTWNTAGAQTVSVNYTNSNGCTASAPTSYPVTVNALPTPSLSGPSPICQNSTGNVYSTDPGMTNYIWTVSAGGMITAGGGAGNNTVTVTWNTVGAQTVSVNYTNGNGCTATSSTLFNVTVAASPTANAGPDTSICFYGSYTIKNASVSNATSYTWSTTGGGTFENGYDTINNIINPTYTPGGTDTANTSVPVQLVLTANGVASCNPVSDTMTLTITPKLVASVGALAPFPLVFTGGPNDTKVTITFATQNYYYIQGLSYYLISPDGKQTVILNQILDPFTLPCSGEYSLDADSVTFVNNTSVPTLNICPNLFGSNFTLEGTFQATGNWNVFNGMNPASGGWTFEVMDRGNSVAPPGFMKYASLTFIKGNPTSPQDTVIFDSGPINIPIAQGNIVDPAITTFTVPRSLSTRCSNSCDAEAVVNVIGGTAPYTYQWSDASLPAKDTVALCKGTYTVTVTDKLGCQTTANVNVTSPDPIHIDSLVFSNGDSLKCFGDSTNLKVYLSGGTGTIKYTIDGSTKNNGNPVSGIKAGTYPLHIFDSNDCTKDTTITIVQPAQFSGDSLNVYNVTCNGANNGKISLRGHQGTPPYHFGLENNGVVAAMPQITNDSASFTGLVPSNDYLIWVTDKFGCTPDTFKNIVITQPAVLSINTIDTSNYICFGQTNGFIQFQSVSGGTRPYQYSINGGIAWQPDSSFTNLGPGVYNLSVKDTNNCTAIIPAVTLKGANQLVIDSTNITNVTTCYNDASGSIKIYASGETGMLKFSLDTFPYQADSTFSGLLGGTYTLHVKDTLTTCMVNGTATINAPPAVLIDSIVPVNAHDSIPGSFTVYAHGGTPPLSYSDNGVTWQPGNVFSNLSVGKYYVYVQDSKGCNSALDSVFISNLSVIVTTTNVKCRGTATGSITLVPTESGTFEYSINGGTTYQDSGVFTNLFAGNYAVQVKDQTGAEFNQAVTISQPALAIDIIDISPLSPTCYDGNNGVINGVAIGMTPLQYSINGGSFEPNFSFSNLTSGTYQIIVQDVNGCQKTSSVVVPNPDPISITTIITNVVGLTKGSIKIVTVANGNPPYQFSINGGTTWQTDSTFSNLNGGIYTITTEDASCSHDTTLVVGNGATLDVIPVVTNIKCFGDTTGIISLTMGNHLYTNPLLFLIQGPDTIQTIADNAWTSPDLPGGLYLVSVTDSAGAVYQDTVRIQEPNPLLISGTVSNASCSFFTIDGAITVVVTGGTTPYNYNWSTGSTLPSLTSLTTGHYSLSVTDSNSCKTTQAFTVNSNDSVIASAGSPAQICSDVPYQLHATGGDMWSWTPTTGLNSSVVQNPVLTTNSGGIYNVTVTDAHNCVDTASVHITVYPTYNLRIGVETKSGTEITKQTYVDINKSIQLDALPDSFTSYQWTPPTYLENPTSSNPMVTVTTPVTSIDYQLEATTSEGCVETDSIKILVRSHGLIPTGFTPYPGSPNEVWYLEMAPAYPNILVEVYNRWGELVYMSTGYDNVTKVFRGTLNGRYLPAGTYYFIIDFKDGTSPEKGSVTIVSTGK